MSVVKVEVMLTKWDIEAAAALNNMNEQVASPLSNVGSLRVVCVD